MIRITFTGVQWGTDPIDGIDPETEQPVIGRQLNLQDPQSGILAHVPFTGESLLTLVQELAKGLTDEQRRQLMPEFASGIVLPGSNGAQG